MICRICGWDSREHPETSRTAHLIEVHGMLTFNRMVKRNFLSVVDVTVQDREDWEIWLAGQKMIKEAA